MPGSDGWIVQLWTGRLPPIMYSGSSHPELSLPAFEQCTFQVITDGCAPTGPTLVPCRARVSRLTPAFTIGTAIANDVDRLGVQPVAPTGKVVIMWKPRDRTTPIAVWAGTLATVAVCSALLGASITAGSAMLLLFACVVPPAVALMVWHGPPPATVAEIIHAADRRTDV